MASNVIENYLNELESRLPLDRYIERRFTTVDASGELPVDASFRFRGMLRDREPRLDDILKNPRTLILGEPGGGKTVVARAAVHHYVRDKSRIPILVELKEYRGNLGDLLRKAAPAELLCDSSRGGAPSLSIAYVLDGIDEVPREFLAKFGDDLQRFFSTATTASIFLTGRQAFYAAQRSALPPIPSVFYLLDLNDRDISDYLWKSNVDVSAFLAAVRGAGADEEIRNPFILSVMIEKYRHGEALSDLRSENLSYMIDRLIGSRPRFSRHQQRRALRMLAVALETYSRNELTEDEALRVIKQSRRTSDTESRDLLGELYASILKRTANGLAFQMRSYGEYLAAEALEDEPLERIKELVFLDYRTPNETWLNAISYLLELNAKAREYFVRLHPHWTLSSTPAAFSEEERDRIVSSMLQRSREERQPILHHPLINPHKLARFLTRSTEQQLIADLTHQDAIARGNALVLLGSSRRPEVLATALATVKDRHLGEELRASAMLAVVNAGTADHVPELLAALDAGDPMRINYLDMIGALIDESQIETVLPLVLATNAILSSTYYHFRDFRSRDALVTILRYFVKRPGDLDNIRVGRYVEPVLELLPQFFDQEVAEVCADFLRAIETQKLFPRPTGSIPKVLELMRNADREGTIVRAFYGPVISRNNTGRHPLYFNSRYLAALTTPQTAQWLINRGATEQIRELAPFSQGEVRRIFQDHWPEFINAENAASKAYEDVHVKEKEERIRYVKTLQERLLSRTSLNDAVADLSSLPENYWPELPDKYHGWLAAEVSRQMNALDLKNTIQWNGDTLSLPSSLPYLLRVVDRYALKIEPDEPLVFVLAGLDREIVANYHKRFPLSETARATLERLIEQPKSSQALDGLLRFVESSGIWSQTIQAALKEVASNRVSQDFVQLMALLLLVAHGVDVPFIEEIMEWGATEDLRNRAFECLVERQHRPTIERSLARLTDDDLKAGSVRLLEISPLAWFAKIKSDFAWTKLVKLRARGLQLELPMFVGLVTDVLANINRARAAKVIREQVDVAPESWKPAQRHIAIEQQRTARIEAAQLTPFEDVLKRLKGSTSINRLKLLTEGSTDIPVFRALIDQLEDVPDIIIDSVGGWPNLRAKPDPNVWLLGSKEVIIVMDGDQGRHLTKRGKPYTELAKQERKKLAGLPISFCILERYGIENYFPRQALEKVLAADLSDYFPIPDHVPAIERLSVGSTGLRHRLRKFAARTMGFRCPPPRQPLYSKERNAEVAHELILNDLQGTDLFDVIQQIGQVAKRLLDE